MQSITTTFYCASAHHRSLCSREDVPERLSMFYSRFVETYTRAKREMNIGNPLREAGGERQVGSRARAL